MGQKGSPVPGDARTMAMIFKKGSVTRDAARILLRRSVTEVLATQVCNGKNIS